MPHPLSALRVGQIRAIFQLPAYQGIPSKLPLAYIEWFTPFHRCDPATHMFIVSHSTRQHQQHSAIVPITDITRTCHLIPQWGTHTDRSWASDMVLDQAILRESLPSAP